MNDLVFVSIQISIFASGQALAFSELMRRVRPMQDVAAVREEVKVRKIERLSGKTAAVNIHYIVIDLI